MRPFRPCSGGVAELAGIPKVTAFTLGWCFYGFVYDDDARLITLDISDNTRQLRGLRLPMARGSPWNFTS